jgi:predicted RNase H-like HicB family nuclease
VLSAYPACFYKEKNGGYSVIFPDLNHLATCGDTLDEALNMAVDCLAGHLHFMRQSGEKPATPSDMETVDINSEYDDYAEAFVNIVTVDLDEYARAHFEKTVRKNCTIPKWINDAAIAENINFSQVLQNALVEKLHLNSQI